VVKAIELSGVPVIVLRRNSVSGTVDCAGVRSRAGSARCLAAEVAAQELLGRRVELQPVLRLGEAMSLVGELADAAVGVGGHDPRGGQV
jgi:hypothetical protein